jgi:CheY-like chemotaxis protein
MKTILVLDDNKSILDVLSTSLCKYFKDCTIATASDGNRGAVVLSSRSVDMILADLDMPVAKGYQFIEHAKKNYPAVPLCVMTGDCSPAVIERLRSMGVDAWIEKPFEFEKLAALMSETLNQGPEITTQQ